MNQFLGQRSGLVYLEGRVLTRLKHSLLLLGCGFVCFLNPASSPAQSTPEEKKAIAAIEKLGGKVTYDPNRPGKPAIGVSFAGTKVTDAGLKELPGLRNLTTLSLGDTKVTDEGLKNLAGLKDLSELDLSLTQTTDKGLKELAGLKNLAML
jgi:Leucine-rich repeat (LRR) protein